MYELQNAAGEHLASMDPEGDVFNIYRENFDMNYNNNRAPFGVYLHAPVRSLTRNLHIRLDRVSIYSPLTHLRSQYIQWFNDKNTDALNQFMEYAMAKPDVWVLTMRQLADWMKNPVPASKMGEWLTCKNVTLTPAVGTIRCQQYTVQPGDSAYSIATAFAVTTEDFILANGNNPNFGSGENMQPGDSVLIPPWDDGCVGDAVRLVTGPGQIMAQEGFPTDVSDTADPCKTYIAAPQDSWSSVAEIYSVTETDLRDANPDVAGNVSSGVKLRIPPYKDSCPSFTNDPRPNVLGASKGVSDQNGPPSGFRINLFLSGRPKIDYEFDLSAPFKLTLSKVLNTSRENIRFAKITQLDAASRRAMLQVPEVDLELTIPEATPLAMYANVSRDLSMDSQFANSDLKNFRLEMSSQPVIRIIESSVTYDVDPTPLTGATGNSGPSSSSSPSSTSPATSASSSSSSATPSSSGLSSGAIVGIVVGAVAGVLVLVFAVILMKKRRAGRNGSPLDDGASSLQSSPKGKSVGGSDEEYDNDEIEH